MGIVLSECCIIYSVLSMTQIVTPDITRSIPIKVPVDRMKSSSAKHQDNNKFTTRDWSFFSLHLIGFHNNFKQIIVVICFSELDSKYHPHKLAF